MTQSHDSANLTAPADLTICTVSYNSKRYLDFSLQLTQFLNKGPQPRWFLTENSRPDSPERVTMDDSRYELFKEGGPPGLQLEERYAKAIGSYHHAEGLHKIVSEVSTRFLLILDPDFYIVRHNWVQDVLEHMKANDLSFFGVPWHPSGFIKYRYFPCVHCMFIDLSKVDKTELNFSPRVHEKDVKDNGYQIPRLARIGARLMGGKDYKKYLGDNKRTRIGGSLDTGVQVFERFGKPPRNKQFRSECIPSVMRELDPIRKRKSFRVFEQLFLPEALSYIPRRPGYTTTQSFKDFGRFDVKSQDWDEFLWRGLPFGFHVRNQPKIKRGLSTPEEQIEHLQAVFPQIVPGFEPQYAHSPAATAHSISSSASATPMKAIV